MRTAAWVSVVLVIVAGLPACESVSSRIGDNQALFDQYPPEQQALIRAGRIGIGFDRTQVYMALGSPNSQRGGGADEEWFYTSEETRSLEMDKDVREYARERDAWEEARRRGERLSEPSLTVTVHQGRTRIDRSVRFVNGAVASYEEPTDLGLTDWVTTSVE